METRRRNLVRVTAFLLLGAIINIAVAWAAAIWSPIRHTHSHNAESNPPISTWFAGLDDSLTASAAVLQFELSGVGRDAVVVTPAETFWMHARSGWPMRSLEHACTQVRRPTLSTRGCWALAVRSSASDPVYGFVPLHPVWPGFAVDTLLYAGLLWLLFATRREFIRRLRLKRGLCPACAYPIGASDVCTECGAPLSSPSPDA